MSQIFLKFHQMLLDDQISSNKDHVPQCYKKHRFFRDISLPLAIALYSKTNISHIKFLINIQFQYVLQQCAKLRTSRTFAPYVPYMPTCLRAFVLLPLMCLPFLPALRAFIVFYLLYMPPFFYVPTFGVFIFDVPNEPSLFYKMWNIPELAGASQNKYELARIKHKQPKQAKKTTYQIGELRCYAFL